MYSIFFVSASKPYVKLEEILESKYLINDLRKMSPHEQTSALESFHSVMLIFMPPKNVFSYEGMVVR